MTRTRLGKIKRMETSRLTLNISIQYILKVNFFIGHLFGNRSIKT